jgi:hypothetical protein
MLVVRTLMHHPFDWQQVHRELSRIAQDRARLDWEEGTWLVRGLRTGVHLHLGFASFIEYVERVFGYSARWTEERLRVAEAIEQLPELEQSLRDGIISWSAARELTRVATANNEGQWLEAAKGCTARQVEQMVSGHKTGDMPCDPADPALRRHVVRMEVSADTLATFREATAKVRRDAGEPLDDDAVMLLMARQVLGGPSDEGRANFQVALTVCDACGRGWQQARGEQLEVAPEVVEMAACDAQMLGHVASAHVGGELAQEGKGQERARQDIPPSLRRKIMRRDGGRCIVPGCRHVRFVDIHHIRLRSEGGDHDEDNLVVLCSAHHRAEHRGQLVIEGCVSTGLVFRHSDGSRYGSVSDPAFAEAHACAFRALRSLGFRESETRAALDRVRNSTRVGEPSTERVIREALGILSSAQGARTPQ